MTTARDSVAKLMNDGADGWVKAMGLSFVQASADVVELEWTVRKEHLQPYGIVHGGVHCGVIETTCSIGAALSVASRGGSQGAVGLENHTTFIRATREGAVLRCKATPLTRGRTTQVWQAEVREGEALIATGRVRLLVVEPSALPK